MRMLHKSIYIVVVEPIFTPELQVAEKEVVIIAVSLFNSCKIFAIIREIILLEELLSFHCYKSYVADQNRSWVVFINS